MKLITMRLDRTVRRHGEYLLIQQLFVHNNKKTKRCPTFSHSHPENSRIFHMLSVRACLQHRIMGFENGTTVKQFLVLPKYFGICNHQDASLEGRKDGHHLVRSQGCMVDVRDTPIKIAATRLPVVRRAVWGLGTK
jgi:hypothetical protein